MTVSTAAATAQYNGNGTTQIFNVPFYFLVDGDVKVSKLTGATGVISVLTLNSDYTLTGAGNQQGGSATLVVAPLSGDQIFIERNVSAVQETAYPENGNFPAASHEKALDRLTMLVQQLQTQDAYTLTREPLSDAYDVGDNRIGNVADAVDPQDVPSLLQVQGLITSGAAPALAGSNGSALVGFIQQGTGAAARTVQDKLRDSVSVKDFGAKGDGTTDDAAAFNAALAAAAATPNRRLYVPSGTYRVASELTAVTGQGVFMHGDGVVPVVGSTGNGVNTRGAGSWIWFDHAGAGLTLGSSGTLSLEKLGFVRTQTTPTDVSFAPIETGYDIDFAGNDLFIRDVVLLNPTYGIYNRGGGRIWIDGLLGQPLKVGLRVDANTDTSRIQNVHWWPFWTNQNGVRVYQKLNADAFLIYRMDNPTFDSCFCIGFAHMFNFQNNANGQFNKVRISNCDCDLGSSFIVVDSSCASGSLYVSNCVTQGTTSDFLSAFHNISIGGSNATVFINNTTLNVAQGACLRVNGTGNRVFLTNVAINNWNQSGSGYTGISVATSGNKVYSKNAPISLWTSATSAAAGATTGSTLSFEEFAGYFSSDGGTTSKRLPDGWTVSKLGTGNYSLVHNLGLSALDDMAFSLTPDNATSGALAQIDRTNSGTANVRIRTYVGTTATDCGVFFTARPVRT